MTPTVELPRPAMLGPKHSGVTASWVHEQPPVREAVYIDVDGNLWLCISHWGPVHDTGILAPHPLAKEPR